MRKSKIITYIIGLIAFLIPVKLYLTPPKDYDGGPMMAYNLLFFYPLVFFSIVLSIAMVFRLRYFGKEVLPKIVLFISILPSSILTIMVLINFIRIANEPEPVERSDRIHNNSTSIVLDGKTLHLTGFNYGKNYERRRIYISEIPYFNKEFNITDAYFCQGGSEFELFYSSDSDSIFVFVPKSEPMYHYINGKNLDKVPVRAIQLINSQIDSLKNIQSGNMKRFEWKENTETNTIYSK